MPRIKPRAPSLRRGHPRARHLAGCWPLAEGAGPTARDASGRGLHGTLSGPAAWEAGPDGPAVSLPASPALIEHGRPLPAGVAAFSFLLRLRLPASLAFSDLAGLWSPKAHLLICFGADLDWYVRNAADTAEANAVVPGSALRLGDWNNLAFVADGAVLRGYANGRAAGTTPGLAGPYLPASTAAWAVGAGAYTGNLMPLSVGLVAYHDRALSAGEVAQWSADPFGLLRDPGPSITDLAAAMGGGPPPATACYYAGGVVSAPGAAGPVYFAH